MKRGAHLIKPRQIDTEGLSMLNIQIFQTETKVQIKRLQESLVTLQNPGFLGGYGIRITIKIFLKRFLDMLNLESKDSVQMVLKT